ncbi:ABC transporter substrate-binding protein [Anaerolineales bacterium]
MLNRKAYAVIVSSVLLLLLSVGVMSITAQEWSSLSVGIAAPVNLDPALGSNDVEILFNRSIYDYLIDIAPDGSLIPNLATDWEVSDDGLVYTVNLREGVSFHDGSDFNAADVVFTFDRLKAIESSALSLLGDFEVEAVDDYTVMFTLEEANADFAFGIASRWAFILPDGQETPNVIGEGETALSNFNGTGAWILSEYKPGERASFVRNEAYWLEGEPVVDTLNLIFIEDQQAQIDALQSGVVDIIFKVAYDRVEELSGMENLKVSTVATNQHPVIRLRSDEGHLGEDPLVRQAFKLATDRELLNLDLFGGLATIGNNDPIGPIYGLFYTPMEQVYDPEAACELLAEAGYPDGLGVDEPLTFYVVDAFNYSDMAINLQDQWSEACINVDILMRPENVYYGDNEWMEVDLGVTGWGSRPIPQQYFVEAYISSGLYNESHWSDMELDELVAQASVTADIEQRSEIYSQISQIFAERGPIIVPFFAPIVGVSDASVEGFNMHPFVGRTDLRTVSNTE